MMATAKRSPQDKRLCGVLAKMYGGAELEPNWSRIAPWSRTGAELFEQRKL